MSVVPVCAATAPAAVPSAALQAWLTTHAQALHEDASQADALLPQLHSAGLLATAVPKALGGDGQAPHAAVQALAQVAESSLTAAFVLWAQRAFIDYLCVTDNAAARDHWLPQVLSGRLAGATGLSNAMKFLSQLEPLQVQAHVDSDGVRQLQGRMPWVTNLRRAGFVVAAAVQPPVAGQPPFIVALGSDSPGVSRSDDLDLLGLRGSNTAAVALQHVQVPAHCVLAEQGLLFLKRARPMFLSLQCGMSIGLVRAALRAAEQVGAAREVLQPRIQRAWEILETQWQLLRTGLDSGQFVEQAPALFQIRLTLAALVQEALQLELQGSGGRAYLRNQLPDFGRRLQESAFVPVVTPSLTQLQGELLRQGLPMPGVTGVPGVAGVCA